jgi:hypothetical protein
MLIAALLVGLPADAAVAKKHHKHRAHHRHHKRPTKVFVDTWPTPGVPGQPMTLTGSVKSKGPCVDGRTAIVFVGGGSGIKIAGTAITEPDGSWRLATTSPAGTFWAYAVVPKQSVKRSVCKSATSKRAQFIDAPPALNVTAPTGGVTGPAGPISWSTSEPATVTCTLNGAPLDPCSEYDGLQDGMQQLVLTATDASGGQSTKSVTFYVDATPPAVVITSPASGDTVGSAFNLEFNLSDYSQVPSIECQLDAGAPFACTTPQPFSGVAPGSHTIYVTAQDAYGNTSPTATVTVTVS